MDKLFFIHCIFYKNIPLNKARDRGVNKQQVPVNKQRRSAHCSPPAGRKTVRGALAAAGLPACLIDPIPLLVYGKGYSIEGPMERERFADI
jgi:hypothetical protein